MIELSDTLLVVDKTSNLESLIYTLSSCALETKRAADTAYMSIPYIKQ